MSDRKHINFTIVPGEAPETRVYSNFCAVSHTPFDVTLSFCEVLPLSDHDLQTAESNHVVKAPVRVSVALPLSLVPTLIAALQENMRAFAEAQPTQVPPAGGQGPVH